MKQKIRYETISRDGTWWIGGVQGSKEVGQLIGPYSTRETAYRRCRELNSGAPPSAPRVQIVHDTDATTHGADVAAYVNCGRCLDELPSGTSPRDYARQQLAILADGRLQLRCTRHDINITTMTFELVQ